MSLSPSQRAALALAILLGLFGARLVHTTWAKSFTIDEPHYVGTGRYLWASGDYHWFHTLLMTPPLAYHLASLPLLVTGAPEGLALERNAGYRFVERAETPLTQLRVASRLPFVLLAMWGGFLVFAWAREAAGPAAGVLAAFAYTFSPAVAGFGALAHSDLPVAVFTLQTLYTFWRWWQRPGPRRLAICGVSLGLALATKTSAVLLPPMLALVLAALLWRPHEGDAAPERAAARLAFGARALLGIGALGVGVLWLAYGGSFAATPDEAGPLADVPLPGYLRALLVTRSVALGGELHWFFGRLAEPAWYFLPAGFLVKTPLPLLALALAAVLRRLGPRGREARLGLFLGLPAAIYLAVACFVLRVPLGVRFLLPVYPLLFVAVGAALADLGGRARAAVIAACVALAVVVLAAHPHYLSYFNASIGGPRNAHRYFADSNLDWGQDVGTLARWLAERGDPPVRTALFTAQRPAAFGIRAVPLEGCRPVRSGLVAISAAVLRGFYSPDAVFRRPPPGCHAWLEEHEPVDWPGYSILLFDLDRDPNSLSSAGSAAGSVK